MRTPRKLYPEKTIVYACEQEQCPLCHERMVVSYTSGTKIVQTMEQVLKIAQQPKHCTNPTCAGHQVQRASVQWQRSAPKSCSYGYEVIAQIGWQRQTYRQTFQEIHSQLGQQLQISESQVRSLYHLRYLPLLACDGRQNYACLGRLARQSGLFLAMDGLAPEGGEPQLWWVWEMQTGWVLRSGWLSQQDQTAFANFLRPIADLKLSVAVVMSDKQRGLVPAVAEVFPQVKHAFCQLHYLNNVVAPLAEADEAMKVDLRQAVRAAVGPWIRQEAKEAPGVLTVTGMLPSPIETPPPTLPERMVQEGERIVSDLCQRVRYLLTLKGRPPFRLAGIEMVERLSEVENCLVRLIAHRTDPQLVCLQQGLNAALQATHQEYQQLRQVSTWVEQIAACLDPQGSSPRSGAQVHQELNVLLERIHAQSQENVRLSSFYAAIQRTTEHYAPGLFHSYDIPGLPRTNNGCESKFRDLNRRLLRTTGQKGLTRRILHREGAWELLPHPASLPATIQALAKVAHEDFKTERQRIIEHRNRFRLHSRSAKAAHKQLDRLEQSWFRLSEPT